MRVPFAPLAPLVFVIAACGDAAQRPPVERLRAYCGEDHASVEARVDDLLRELTLDEKVAMMHGTGIATEGGVYTTTRDDARGIPGLRMVDGPRGVSSGTGNATAFPVGMARGATWDPELEARVGAAIGREARAVGASVLLAPTMNVLRHPRWGRAQETYGEDPTHIGAMAVGFVGGVQEHVMASAKHFAVNSIENTRFVVDVQVDARTLREIYLPHFRRVVVEGHVASVMSAYNRVNGEYCGENPHLLRDILKGEWGFLGFVESDWVLGTRSTVPSALAGLDVEMPLAQFYGYPLVTAVDVGDVPERVVDDAVRRILRAQLCYRMDSDPPVVDRTQIETPGAIALARETAERAIVLLRNEGGALPITRGTEASIVVVGPLADAENIGDTGSSKVRPSYVVTPLEGLLAAAGDSVVTHVTGDVTVGDDAAAVANADVVLVFVGLTAADEGESVLSAGDRAGLALRAEQIALIEAVAAANDRVVVVLEGGSAITMGDWIDDVEAVLMAWYPGMEGGSAIASVLFGDVSPSGRLPIVFAAAEADLPAFDGVSDVVTYGYLHGYRHLDAQGTTPLFPFGFGLAYTTFAIADLALESETVAAGDVVRATVAVTNTGAAAAIETVQLYVHAATSTVERAPRELEAFAQVALAPGETRTVTLTFDTDELAYFDVDTNAFVVERTAYVVEVGAHEQDVAQMATFMVQ